MQPSAARIPGYNWMPFKVNISKNFQNPTLLKVSYFGELEVLNNNKLLFSDVNYESIKTIKFNLLTPDLKINFQYYQNPRTNLY